jgi:hypothetical protein
VGSGKTLWMTSELLRANQTCLNCASPLDVVAQRCLVCGSQGCSIILNYHIPPFIKNWQFMSRMDFINLSREQETRRRLLGEFAVDPKFDDVDYWLERAKEIKAETFGIRKARIKVGVDEIAMWGDNRLSMDRYVRSLTYTIFQSRKLGFDLYITSQIVHSFDVRIRELCDMFVKCSAVYDGSHFMGFLYEYILPDRNPAREFMDVNEAVKVAAMYDTKEVIHPEYKLEEKR